MGAVREAVRAADDAEAGAVMRAMAIGRVGGEIRNGALTAIESVAEFMDWAESRKRVTWEDVRDHYGCSRATAYRWAGAWRAIQERRRAAA